MPISELPPHDTTLAGTAARLKASIAWLRDGEPTKLGCIGVADMVAMLPIVEGAVTTGIAQNRAARAQAEPDDSVTSDQVIELAAALEQQRAYKIVADVAALNIGTPAAIPTPFQAGYQLACEEIGHRLRTEQWEVGDDGTYAPIVQPAARAQGAGEAVRAALAELVACKELKEQLEVMSSDTDPAEDCQWLKAEYERRKPLAWNAAREALTAPTIPQAAEVPIDPHEALDSTIKDCIWTASPSPTATAPIHDFASQPSPQDSLNATAARHIAERTPTAEGDPDNVISPGSFDFHAGKFHFDGWRLEKGPPETAGRDMLAYIRQEYERLCDPATNIDFSSDLPPSEPAPQPHACAREAGARCDTPCGLTMCRPVDNSADLPGEPVDEVAELKFHASAHSAASICVEIFGTETDSDGKSKRWTRDSGFPDDTFWFDLLPIGKSCVHITVHPFMEAGRGDVVDAEFPGTPTIAECIAQLDVWNGHLEAAIDRQAHEKLGQHANDEPAAGGFEPLEQLP